MKHMGRGLSPLQAKILGVAYTVNAFTQGGAAKVKEGAQIEGWTRPVSNYRGAVDYVTPLGVHLIYGIPVATQTIRRTRYGPVTQDIGHDAHFATTPEVKRAKAAASRAITRLWKRELVIYRPRHGTGGWERGPYLGDFGYLLTKTGLQIGREHACEIPWIETTLQAFGVTATTVEAFVVPGVEYVGPWGLQHALRTLSVNTE
jgi:hypothetical protein